MSHGIRQKIQDPAAVAGGGPGEGRKQVMIRYLEAEEKGNYNVIQINPDYVPAPIEKKQVYGVTFEQGRNELNIDDELLSNIVTQNKEVPEQALIDMKVALIVLKYTQSNSVCYVKNGQAIGIGAGQQSRVHCTRLAGQKADNWFLRQSPKVLGLQFLDTIGRAERDNAIDVYIGEEYMDVLADGAWEKIFKVKPDVFTREEKRAWLDQLTDVTLGSDAFFRLLTTLNVRIRAVSNISHSLVEASEMIWSSNAAINIIWLWHSPESACSITKFSTNNAAQWPIMAVAQHFFILYSLNRGINIYLYLPA